MNLGSRNNIKVEGGMASMTDLVFLLLIFFIIMSLMSNKTMHVDLPKPGDKVPNEQPNVTPTLIVTENNQYVVMPGGSMDTPMEFDEIKELAAAAVMNSPELKLKIEGHRNADYEAVFKALALTKANGWIPVLAFED